MKEFHRPTFLRPETTLEKGYVDEKTGEESFFGGSFVVVAELKKLPREMRRKVPEGCVLKEYTLDEYSVLWNELFRYDKDLDLNDPTKKREYWVLVAFDDAFKKIGRRPSSAEVLLCITDEDKTEFSIDEEVITEILEKYSLKEKSKKLKQRYDRIRGVFEEELPGIIVPTQFVLGAEQNKEYPDKDGGRRLYELQPKVQGLTVPEIVALKADGIKDLSDQEITRFAQKWVETIKENFPNKVVKQIKEELKTFIDFSHSIPETLKETPYDMVHPYNVKFTQKGVRIVDVNLVYPYPDKLIHEKGRVHFLQHILEVYNRCLDLWQNVCNGL